MIVEGVEKQDQLEFFQGIGCSLVQGFLFSPAVEHRLAEGFIMVPMPVGQMRPRTG
jgi:EAL domain-containing protein (putative c-di-GMP-specific phosphodiesterase class I)